MPTQVQLPDGSIGEFPDGMSQDQISAVLQKQFPPPAPPIKMGEHGMGTIGDTLKEGGKSLLGMAQGAGKILSGGSPEGMMQNFAHSIIDPSVEEYNTPSQKGVMIGGTGHETADRLLRSVPLLAEVGILTGICWTMRSPR